MPKQLTVNLLGGFDVRWDGRPVTGFRSDKAAALLTYLILEPQSHTRRQLAGLLWSERDDAKALTNLRITLFRMRKAFDALDEGIWPGLLEASRQSLALKTDLLQADVLTFLDLLQSVSIFAVPHREDAEKLPNTAPAQLSIQMISRLEEAVALYQGELLAGLHLSDVPLFEEWLMVQREIWHRRAVLTCSNLAEACQQAGDYARAHAALIRFLMLEPYSETGYRQLMSLLAVMGRPEQAQQAYRRLEEQLHAELGVSPSAQTRELATAIADGKPDLAIETPVADGVAARHSVSPKLDDRADIPNPGVLFGRLTERRRLEAWLLRDRCSLVLIQGMGGIGKTSLAAACTRSLAESATFDLVLWRSLINAPPLADLLGPLLQTLAGQRLAELPAKGEDQLRMLLLLLREQRVLLVLDNFESVLDPQGGDSYRAGYDGYERLLHLLATHRHDSHVLVTSRERPRGLVRLERDGHPVRTLELEGLDDEAGLALLAQRGLTGNDEQERSLVQRYSGNALALKLVADTVEDLFHGDVGVFLAEATQVFDDIRTVLDQQFDRLKPLEQEILYWLAVEREPISVGTLRDRLAEQPASGQFLEAIRNLRRRSLVESVQPGLGLQNVVTEYVTERLVDEVGRELESGPLVLLRRQALMTTGSREYVRESQVRLILAPAAQGLSDRHSRGELERLLHGALDRVRQQGPRAPGYAAGNLLNLILHLSLPVREFDFSDLVIRQAYLRDAELIDANFARSHFADAVLGDAFGSVRALAFSPTGEMWAAGTASGQVALWHTADAQLTAVLDDDAAPIWSVAFSPDGAFVAAGGTDRVVRLWESCSGRLIKRLEGHSKTVRCVAFSPDGRWLAAGGDNRTIQVWGMPGADYHATLTGGHRHTVRAIAFSPDGDVLASGSEDRMIQLWDPQRGQIMHSLAGHDGEVRSLAFSPDGRLLASCGYDQRVLIWNMGNGALQQTIAGHMGWVETVRFSPDGCRLASAGDDRTVRIWEVASGRNLRTLLGHSGVVNAVDFSPDGTLLLSGDDDRNIYLWDVASGQAQHRLLGHILSVDAVAVSTNGRYLACGIGDQTVRFWRRVSPQQRDATPGYLPHGRPLQVGHVQVIAMTADGQQVAAGTADRSVALIDVESARVTATLHGHEGWVKSVAFNVQGTLLASGSTDRTIRLWDPASRRLVDIIIGHEGWINGLAFSRDGRFLASAGADAAINIWDPTDGRLCATLMGHTGWVNDIAFSPDSTALFSAGADGTIRVWDCRNRQEIRRIKAHTGWVWKIACTADGEILITGSHDKTARLWHLPTLLDGRPTDAAGGETALLATLRGHAPWVTDIALASDAGLLVTSSGQQIIRLWNLTEAETAAVPVPQQSLKVLGPYAGMNITDVTGFSPAKHATLLELGAWEQT